MKIRAATSIACSLTYKIKNQTPAETTGMSGGLAGVFDANRKSTIQKYLPFAHILFCKPTSATALSICGENPHPLRCYHFFLRNFVSLYR
jgi:hypothetical protein